MVHEIWKELIVLNINLHLHAPPYSLLRLLACALPYFLMQLFVNPAETRLEALQVWKLTKLTVSERNCALCMDFPPYNAAEASMG